jgi:hypothetical protein
MQEVLFESAGDGGLRKGFLTYDSGGSRNADLSTCAETSQPDRNTLLLEQFGAFSGVDRSWMKEHDQQIALFIDQTHHDEMLC